MHLAFILIGRRFALSVELWRDDRRKNFPVLLQNDLANTSFLVLWIKTARYSSAQPRKVIFLTPTLEARLLKLRAILDIPSGQFELLYHVFLHL